MKLVLERVQLDADVTIGALSADGDFLAWTCEDTVRGNGDPATVDQWKVKRQSAIPFGATR